MAIIRTSHWTQVPCRRRRCRSAAHFTAAILSITALVAIVTPAHATCVATGQIILEARVFSEDTSGDYLCTAQMMRRDPSLCPPFGPYAREVRLNYLRSRLPDPLPTLAVQDIERPDDAISPYSFAYVRPLPAPTYRHPEEAAVGLPPLREFLAGDNWVTAMGTLDYNGESWYEINPEEYIRAEYLSFTRPSRFAGVIVAEQPQYPFGWMNRDVYPSAIPGGGQRTDVVLQRYERITMYAQELLGNQLWYMVGPDQWVEQSYTSRVDVDPRPEGVGIHERWIEINTYEQTIAAYEGDRMVFATLTSTGRSSTWTPDGLTRIWSKLPSTPMRNQDVGPDSPAWYYLEDVEWTQYFNGAYALHAAYWHNSFAFTRSHGCVNLSILDARWLFNWTTPYTPSDAEIVYSHHSDMGTWVWVHKTAPAPDITISN